MPTVPLQCELLRVCRCCAVRFSLADFDSSEKSKKILRVFGTMLTKGAFLLVDDVMHKCFSSHWIIIIIQLLGLRDGSRLHTLGRRTSRNGNRRNCRDCRDHCRLCLKFKK